MNNNRRIFLRGTVATGAAAVALGSGLLRPSNALAAWPKSAFEAKSVEQAMHGLFDAAPVESRDIDIKAPDIAENGAVVPVTVSTTIPNSESIAIVAAKNGTPLAATFNLSANTEGTISTRIKMGKTSDVIALVKSGGKVYSHRKEIKVTIGGCGG